MENTTLRIGLASPRPATSRDEAVSTVERFLSDAAAREVAIVCFPETYVPGYRSDDFPQPPPDQAAQERALEQIRALARRYAIAAIVPMEWQSPAGLLNLAFVVDPDGAVQGYQTKNQVAPEEEPIYAPGNTRRLFDVGGVPFGIVICHEGWRYPESVRWAARRGAKVVFHPNLSGNDVGSTVPRFFGEPVAPYFENALIARAMENTVYVASVNFALRGPETATVVIAPNGQPIAHLPYGADGLLVADLDLAKATGLYARRVAPERYPE